MSVLVCFELAKLICLATEASGYEIARIILQQAEDSCDSAEGTGHGKGKGSIRKDHWHPVAFWLCSMASAE